MKDRKGLIVWCPVCILISLSVLVIGTIVLSTDLNTQSFCKDAMEEACFLGNGRACNCLEDVLLSSQSCDPNVQLQQNRDQNWTDFLGDSITCRCSNSTVCIDVSPVVHYERVMRIVLVITGCLLPIVGFCISLALC